MDNNLSTEFKHLGPPDFVYITGKGRFHFGDSSVESSFVLYRNPHWIGIVSNEPNLCEAAAFDLSPKSAAIQLSGILNDGKPVRASELHITNTQIGKISSIELTAFEGVSIGQEMDTPPTESRYPLTGYFDGEFDIAHNGWGIKTIPCQSVKTAKALAKKWGCPVEGVVLQLRRENSTMDKHREFARVVMALLSLACGTGVSCHRHFFTWGNAELENWRHMTGNEIGPGPIVPEFEHGRFLEQTLPAWQKLSEVQREAIRLALYNINESAVGYIDTRLFHIVQPWEFLAEAWRMKGELPDSVTLLHSRLQKVRKQWDEDYPNSDPHGFWGSRISSIFGWPKLRDAIERLAASFGLDLGGVGLDLKLLKEARDSVAHSGKLAQHLTGPNRKALDLLAKGQYCLQLLLLRMLGYKGLVNHAKGGWRTFVDIDIALTTEREWRQFNKPIKRANKP